MNLPININQLLHGKAVECERLEFEFDKEHTYFQVKLPVHGEVVKERNEDSDLTPEVTPHVTPPMLKNYYLY